MRISKLLYRSDKWTKGALGRDKDGNPVELYTHHFAGGREFDSSSIIVAYSLYGAVAKLYGCSNDQIIGKLKNAIYLVTGQRSTLADFNNRDATTFEDIQTVLKLSGQ